MSKYIDAGKLKYEIERRNLSERYITTERYEEELYEIIDSLEEEQKIWKPTEEQMEALKYFVNHHQGLANQLTTKWDNFEGLKSLYNDLKKLM